MSNPQLTDAEAFSRFLEDQINNNCSVSTISVELPDELHQFVEASVQRGEFANPSEYIAALVHAAHCKRSDIEAALLAGLESAPAEEWTSDERATVKQRVIERHRGGD